jgi:hypothetical protein
LLSFQEVADQLWGVRDQELKVPARYKQIWLANSRM